MFAILTSLLCYLLFGTPSVAMEGNASDPAIDGAREVEKRSIDRSLKIGIFRPLICEGFYRHHKDRRERGVSDGPGRSKLGFFTPVYCKHFEQWMNNRHHVHVRRRCLNKNSDCYEILQCNRKHNKNIRSGVYWIKPKHYKPFQVYCDMKTDGGGWTVFQHRFDGSQNFYNNWSDYKKGFGTLSKEFWLGNDNIHAIVSQGRYALRVDLQDYAGNKRYASYRKFNVGNEKQKYKLTIGGYSGNAGDSMTDHNNQYFSTKDRDNDSWSKHCAVSFTGAWWYNQCYHANMNGLYSKHKTTNDKYNRWYKWTKGDSSMKSSQLAVRWLRKFKYL